MIKRGPGGVIIQVSEDSAEEKHDKSAVMPLHEPQGLHSSNPAINLMLPSSNTKDGPVTQFLTIPDTHGKSSNTSSLSDKPGFKFESLLLHTTSSETISVKISEPSDTDSQFPSIPRGKKPPSIAPSLLDSIKSDHERTQKDAEKEESHFKIIPRSWRDVRALLNHNLFHYFIISLVFFYIAVAFADVLMSLYIQCKPNKEGKCTPNLNADDHFVVGGGGFLYYTSLTIISIFVIEVLLSIVAFGIKYFKNAIRVIDMIIIFGTFVMEVYFKFRYSGEDTIKLIMILNIWKIVRAIHAVSHVMEIKSKKQTNSLTRLNKRIEDEFIRLESSSHNCRKKLRSLIKSYANHARENSDNLLSASYMSKHEFLESLNDILNEMDDAMIGEHCGIANAINDTAGSVLINDTALTVDDMESSKFILSPNASHKTVVL